MDQKLDDEFSKMISAAFPADQAALVQSALALSHPADAKTREEAIHAAKLVIGHHADYIVIIALLLSPLRRDGLVSRAEIERQFGTSTAKLIEQVHGVAHADTCPANRHRESLAKVLDSLAHDIRSAVLQIGARLSKLESATEQDAQHLRRTAQETLDLYVPLAGRLGMGAMRSKLEDVCFRLLEPDIYRQLERDSALIRSEDHECLKLLIDGVHNLLGRNDINAAVEGRTKGLYSLYSKMRRTDLSIEQITDKIGIRIIVSSVPDCYTALGLLHTHFQPIPGTFKDYIGLSKDNGYQSLHTCVYPVRAISNKSVELQIRTEAMHHEAEFGVAAHWYYKSQKESEAETLRQLTWLRSLPAEHRQSRSRDAFVQRLKALVYSNEIVVFGRSGERIRLPYGATAGAFARALGYNASDNDIQVNGEQSPSDRTLKDGDTVWFETKCR